ncbi:SusC/RagA family TonB-linked outer membrane protein [Pontibacter ramchanderi]|uniref:SusC/RagA family TonB-linked outer membrane protein n=1 Tax=Pontibacter ramchanderi TaxID=1179743 RepID=UPI0015D64E40|nr:SusC/RagA family TonB-linked outer membrane protein [Pontibacter ramchanderi]
MPDSANTSQETRSSAIAQQVPKEQLNKGLVYNTEQLLIGQFAGLRLVPSGGSPGTGAEMVMRSGTSLLGNNSPLVVIDGVLLDPFSHSLHASNLSWLNAEDIATVSLLKDAAATALYGGAAANGVLIITTKSGRTSDKMRLLYNATGSVSSLRKKADIFSAADFRELIRERYTDQQHLLGDYDTDWQDEIYRTGFSMMHNLNLSGALGTVPYRIAAGQVNQNGILKATRYKRNSLAINLQPSLLQKHLTFNLSLHSSGQALRLADERAIPAAMAFDPTQPVYADNNFGGYFTHTRPDGSAIGSQINPVSLLEQKENREEIQTLYGQAHMQYRLHFLPVLTTNYRYAHVKSAGDYRSEVYPEMAYRQNSPIDLITHRLKSDVTYYETFVTLDQAIPAISSMLDLKVGLLKTKRENESKSTEENKNELIYSRGKRITTKQENLSYYGSLGYTLHSRYTLKGSFRNLSDVNYDEDILRQRSIALGIDWDIKKESFLASTDVISLLKFRLDVGWFSKVDEPNRFRTALWTPVQGNPIDYGFAGPQSLVDTERTRQKSIGLDFGLMDNRLSGNLGYFQTKSSDLFIPFRYSVGSGYGSSYLAVGGLSVSVLETALHYHVVQKGSANLKLGLHTTVARNEVTSIGDFVHKYTFSDNDYGLALVKGEPAQVFDLYRHLYDSNGKPIQGGYDRSKYGYAIKYPMGSSQPKLYYGISSEGAYGRWDMSLLLRGAAGNQVHNRANAQRSWLYANDQMEYLSNANRSYLATGLISAHTESSHFLEKASFLRMEYLQLGYNAGRVLGNKMEMRVNATAQNAFVLARYSGQDPEVANGIDRGHYPQPRTFSLGLNLTL